MKPTTKQSPPKEFFVAFKRLTKCSRASKRGRERKEREKRKNARTQT